MANLKNFIFNSDYSTDKIAFTKKDTYTITAPVSPWSPKYIFINTHITTQLYAEGDTKLEGSDYRYPMDNSNPDLPIACATLMYKGECWIVIGVFASSSYVGKTFEYRVWAYYGDKEAKNTDIPATTNTNQSRLALNTDNNYPRFILDGEVALGDTYTHSLGYVPYIKVWQKWHNDSIPNPDGSAGTFDGYTYMVYTDAFFGDPTAYTPTMIVITPSATVQASDSQIITYADQSANVESIYFRIYAL